MDEDFNVLVIQFVHLVAQELAKLLVADMVLGQGDVLSADEPSTSRFVYIPRHVGRCQDEDPTGVFPAFLR
jgi:hypothetical protein